MFTLLFLYILSIHMVTHYLMGGVSMFQHSSFRTQNWSQALITLGLLYLVLAFLGILFFRPFLNVVLFMSQ